MMHHIVLLSVGVALRVIARYIIACKTGCRDFMSGRMSCVTVRSAEEFIASSRVRA